MKKRWLGLMLAACLLVSLLPPAQAAGEQPQADADVALTTGATSPAIPTTGDKWDGETLTQPSKLVKVNGVNYYEIAKCAELAFVAQTGGEWLERNYILVNNLILNDVVLRWSKKGNLTNDKSTLHPWTPIGSDYNHLFTGKFDGGGYTVSGLYVEQAASYAGLFGHSGGTIQNVTVVNAHVKGGAIVGGVVGRGSTTGCVFSGVVASSGDYVGGVAGVAGGVINCTNYGAVTGVDGSVGGVTGSCSGSVTGCVNHGAVTGGDGSAGGVVGSCGGGVTDCINHGTVTGSIAIGGVVGICRNGITDCVNRGAVTGVDGSVGGVVGSCNDITGCVSYGAVTGAGNVGGVAGFCYEGRVANCANHGTVMGGDSVGGVVGYFSCGSVTDCINCGAVTSSGNKVGGVAGYCHEVSITGCVNHGAVEGKSDVGGIGGITGYGVSDSRNTAPVTGESNVGGVAGSCGDGKFIANCYNTGNVTCTVEGNNVGGIGGSDGAVWDKFTIADCFYLKTSGVNAELYGCGGVTSPELEPGGVCAKTAAELKQQATYEGWDFTDTWRIDPEYNDGYPYLVWERSDTPELTGIALDRTKLSLCVGKTAQLTASPVPAGAGMPTPRWMSDDQGIAEVDHSGAVTAKSPGRTKITATCGEFSASCVVTVKPRELEYLFGALTVRDASGDAQRSIPGGKLTVTVPVSRIVDGGDATVVLAYYDASGRFLGMKTVGVSGLSVGDSAEFALAVDNSAGNIALFRAMAIATAAGYVPVSAAASFPEQ